MKRGDIWTLASGKDCAGKPRPVVIVQDDSFDATDAIAVTSKGRCAAVFEMERSVCSQFSRSCRGVSMVSQAGRWAKVRDPEQVHEKSHDRSRDDLKTACCASLVLRIPRRIRLCGDLEAFEQRVFTALQISGRIEPRQH